MTIKFRLVLNGSDYMVQTKKWYGWVYKEHVIGMYTSVRTRYEDEQQCINRVINDSKINRNRIRLIQYPSLIIH